MPMGKRWQKLARPKSSIVTILPIAAIVNEWIRERRICILILEI